MTNNIKQLSSDDYHFLNDIETGFSTPNPMNHRAGELTTQTENNMVNNDGKILYLFDGRVRVIVGVILIFGLCVTILLFLLV